jgi:hypothetical protein
MYAYIIFVKRRNLGRGECLILILRHCLHVDQSFFLPTVSVPGTRRAVYLDCYSQLQCLVLNYRVYRTGIIYIESLV